VNGSSVVLKDDTRAMPAYRETLISGSSESCATAGKRRISAR
jgi:hypothetical protein